MFDAQPHLVGELVELRPLQESDFEDLYAVAADPAIWEQHPDPIRFQEDVFRAFFSQHIASGGALLVLDRRTQAAIGTSRFHGYDPDRSEIEIGWTFLGRSYWGGAYNGELKSLMLAHAFRLCVTLSCSSARRTSVRSELSRRSEVFALAPGQMLAAARALSTASCRKALPPRRGRFRRHSRTLAQTVAGRRTPAQVRRAPDLELPPLELERSGLARDQSVRGLRRERLLACLH